MSSPELPDSLSVIGSSGSFPSRGGICSGYLLEIGGQRILLEAGHGVAGAYQDLANWGSIDVIIVSHGHPDHCSDLPGVAAALKYLTRRRGVPLFTCADFARTLPSLPRGVLSTTVVADGDVVPVGGLTLEFRETAHDRQTLAVCIAGPKSSLAFTGDTGPDWAVSSFTTSFDTVLSEASFDSASRGDRYHLSAHQAGSAARDGAADRLILTHRWPTVGIERWRQEAADAFGKDVIVAESRSVIQL